MHAGLPDGVDESQLGYTAFEYEITDAHNAREVFAWAEENAGADRTFTIYATVTIAEDTCLVRLFGVDPTKAEPGRAPLWPGEIYAASE